LVSNLEAVVNSSEGACFKINPSLDIELLYQALIVFVTFNSISFEVELVKD
jgi:hypothetical protein